MAIRYIELALLLIPAVISDFRTCKIDNRLIAAFLIAGTLTGLLQQGLNGLLSSLFGALLPLLLLFWLFWLRMLGAGDIKLFCSIGAVAGIGFIPWCIVWSFLSGGVIALTIMLAKRNAVRRFRHLGNYLKACFLSGSILEYSDVPEQGRDAKFHFSPAIAIGCAIQILLTTSSAQAFY